MTCLQAARLRLPLLGSDGGDHSKLLLSQYLRSYLKKKTVSQIILSMKSCVHFFSFEEMKSCVVAAVAAYPERGQREGPPIREDPTDHVHASYLEWIGLNPNLVRI